MRVDGVAAAVAWPTRGIVAGSVFATAELKLLMLRVMDRACALHPGVVPTVYVDDTSAEADGTHGEIMAKLPPFVRDICDGFVEAGMEVSTTKGQ